MITTVKTTHTAPQYHGTNVSYMVSRYLYEKPLNTFSINAQTLMGVNPGGDGGDMSPPIRGLSPPNL